MRKSYGWIGVLIFSLLFIPLLYGEEGFKIKPSLEATTAYHTNIELKAKDTKSDWITYIKPGISLQMPVEKLYMELDYFPTFACFAKHHDSNYKADTLKGLVRYNFGPHLSVGLEDNYTETEVPGEPGEVYRINTLGCAFKYQVEQKWSSSIGYQKEKFTDPTEEEEFANYEGEKISLEFKNNFTPRTALKAGYVFYQRDFTKSSVKDYDSLSLSLGLTHKFSRLWSGSIIPTWEYRNYPEAEQEAERLWGVKANLKASGYKLKFGVNYSFQLSDTVISPEEGVEPYNLSELMQFYYNYRYAKVERYGVDVSYKVSHALKLNAGVARQVNSYPDEIVLTNDKIAERPETWKTTFDVYQAGFDFQLNKWVSLGIKYQHVYRDNEPGDNYDYDIISGGIKASIRF